MHRPWPEHPAGHARSAHVGAAQPLSHAHAPSTHRPCGPQLTAHTRESHASPSHPIAHEHTPEGGSHLPWRAQPRAHGLGWGGSVCCSSRSPRAWSNNTPNASWSTPRCGGCCGCGCGWSACGSGSSSSRLGRAMGSDAGGAERAGRAPGDGQATDATCASSSLASAAPMRTQRPARMRAQSSTSTTVSLARIGPTIHVAADQLSPSARNASAAASTMRIRWPIFVGAVARFGNPRSALR